ncbi:YCF48-related protein [Porifericola rhodea]|uniref:WD40/YVTN/BNR-like repeat-containing protein n=1 Tax=Porifericola rhodea TaxID=930972 RepID=UPI0026652E69|nr:YCF48-related protein [Porifericola rhodea]WKN32642.1 YCF48-related protein [Porifericola rhodea]
MKTTALFIASLLLTLAGCQSPLSENQNNTFQFKWERLKTPTQASFRGLSVVSEKELWLGGSQASCLLTTDAGKNWQTFNLNVADSLQFRDIEAFDNGTAYLLSAGSPALIYKTNNYGKTWKLQYENNRPDIFLDGMAFWNEETGLVMGDPTDGYFTMLKTTDGGKNWTRLKSEALPEPKNKEAGFAASGTNIVSKASQHAWFASGGGASRVFYTTDAGKSWHHSPTPVQQGEASQGIFSLAFADTLRGVAVGGNYLAPDDCSKIACYTNDGGKNWQPAVQMPSGYRSGVAYFSKDQLFIAVGSNGTDYSTDYGKSWKKIDTVGYHSIQPVPGASIAWLSGDQGHVAKLSW